MEFDILHIILIAVLVVQVFLSQRLYQSVPREVWNRTNDEVDKLIEALPAHQERIVRVFVDGLRELIGDVLVIEEVELIESDDAKIEIE